MSFELTFNNCSDAYRTEIENFVSEFRNELQTIQAQTSGSTGNPKRITLKKEQLIASAKRTNAFFQLDSNSTSFLCLSIKTIGGKMVVIRAIVGDYAVVVAEPSRTPLKSLPENSHFNLISFAPVQLECELANPERLQRISSAFLLGGSAVSSSIEKQCLSLGLPVFVGFGMTETVSHIALREVGSEVYTCLKGVTVNSAENGTQIADSVLGLSLKSSDSIEVIAPNQFKWLGRHDFVINSGGIKIHPEALEQEVSELISGSYAIIGIPDSTWGERCVLVAETTISDEDFKAIQQKIETKFGKYAVPKSYIRHSIPTINGLKINRKLLKEELS